MILAFLKANPLIAWGVAGTVAAGGAAGTYVYVNNPPEPPAQIAALPQDEQPTDEPQAEAAPESEPAPVEAPAPLAELPAPRFDILRVEPDGSAVIAGSAPAESTVELLEAEMVLAVTQAGASGDFAFALDKPLSPGAHELSLRATAPDGRVVVSTETGIVNVPDGGGELLAVVSQEGEASRVMQAPEPVSQPESEQQPQQMAKVEPAPEPERQPETVLAPPSAPVLISAVDVEGKRIFVAGTGEAGRTVKLYLDDRLLGSTTVGPQSGFLLEAEQALSSGDYEVRADMFSANGSFVERRAAVRLIHKSLQPAPEQSVVVAEAEPVAEPEPVAESEPAAEPEPVKTAEVAEQAEELPEIRTGASVIIRRGDNLWRISRRMLGRGIRYTVIYEANRSQIRNPNLIYPGQVLDVPDAEAESDQG